MKQTYETGLNGEKAAEEWLVREKGMRCLERRYRSPRGEIDLIMLDRETLVFVEVKTRRTGAAGLGLMAVSPAKQRRILESAVCYLMRRNAMNASIRFDVIELHGREVLYVPNAFQGGGMFYR